MLEIGPSSSPNNAFGNDRSCILYCFVEIVVRTTNKSTKIQKDPRNSILRQSNGSLATIFEGSATLTSGFSDNKNTRSHNCKPRPKRCRRPPSLSISIKNPSPPNISIQNSDFHHPITAPRLHPLHLAGRKQTDRCPRSPPGAFGHRACRFREFA